MAVKELFYAERPVVYANPRQARRIDPRFRYSRASSATYWDAEGKRQIAPAGTLRLDHDPVTRDYKGPLFEPESLNAFNQSVTLTGTWLAGQTVVTLEGNWFNGSVPYYRLHPGGTGNLVYATVGTISPFAQFTAGTRVTFSFLAKGANFPASGLRGLGVVVSTVLSNGTYSGSNSYNNLLLPPNTVAWSGATPVGEGTGLSNRKSSLRHITDGIYEVSMTVTVTATSYISASIWYGAFAGSPNTSPGILYISSPQLEPYYRPTSFIPTTSAPVTRSADLLSYASTALPSTGTAYIDYTAIEATAGSTLISLANASNQAINLSVRNQAATYNSDALLASYNNTVKASLPLQVPTTSRTQSVITWGATNYQHAKDSSRYAASLAASVPSGLNRLSIGHDAVDPTKAFNGYIHSAYIWRGEMSPDVAEAYVRSELSSINADTYSPTGPAGSLSLIVNTQGAGSDNNKVFTLPANRISTAATALVTGQTYRILTTGTSNFTLVGAASNTVGTVFVATGTTTGTGTAAWHNDIVVTWGDGTESGLEGASAEVGAVGLAHTYPSAGIYPVWVEGRMQNIYYNNIADAADLVRIQAWGTGDMFRKPTTMNGAFYGCSKMDFSTTARTTNLPDTSAVADWTNAFRDCSSITGTFPQLNYSAATTLTSAFSGCGSMTAWPDASTQTQNVTAFNAAWYNCSSLTSFPLINTAAGTNFGYAWYNCSSLTSFPLINTAAGTNFGYAWYGCSSLTSFPLINTAAGTDFTRAWYGCSSLTSFPLINTAAVTQFGYAWLNCSSLTSFPLINTAAGTNFYAAWYGCSSLTSFPLINTAAGTNFGHAWYNCSSLTSFPALALNAATGLASDSSSTYTGFRETWRSCAALTTFPASMFNTTTCTRYLDAWTNCALTATSIENILVSINTAGTSNGNLGIGGGTNAAKTTWTANANTAYDALIARGWTITFNA